MIVEEKDVDHRLLKDLLRSFNIKRSSTELSGKLLDFESTDYDFFVSDTEKHIVTPGLIIAITKLPLADSFKRWCICKVLIRVDCSHLQ